MAPRVVRPQLEAPRHGGHLLQLDPPPGGGLLGEVEGRVEGALPGQGGLRGDAPGGEAVKQPADLADVLLGHLSGQKLAAAGPGPARYLCEKDLPGPFHALFAHQQGCGQAVAGVEAGGKGDDCPNEALLQQLLAQLHLIFPHQGPAGDHEKGLLPLLHLFEHGLDDSPVEVQTAPLLDGHGVAAHQREVRHVD